MQPQSQPDPAYASDRARSPLSAAREANWRALIRRMGEGDHEALSRLYDESSPVLYGLALRILRSPEDAQEVMLDAYSRAWRLAPSYDPGRGSAMSWLVLITRSIAIDRVRSAGHQATRRSEPMDDASEPSDSAAGPETLAEFTQARQRIREALDGIPKEQREAIELAFFEGLSHSELSDRLGVPLGTIKTRIRLGLGRLREQLADFS